MQRAATVRRSARFTGCQRYQDCPSTKRQPASGAASARSDASVHIPRRGRSTHGRSYPCRPPLRAPAKPCHHQSEM